MRAKAEGFSLLRPEDPIARVAESRQDVAMRIELAIERRGDDGHVGMCRVEASYALGGGDEAEEGEAGRARALERRRRVHRAPTRGEHRVEEEDLVRTEVRRDLEVVLDGRERIVVAIEPDVSHPCVGDEGADPIDHSQTGAQDRDEDRGRTQVVAAHRLERGHDIHRRRRKVSRRLIRQERRELRDELAEELRGRRGVAQQRHLVPHEWVIDDGEAGEHGGGRHGREASIFARMKEYQAVILRLTRHQREDEDALTDLLNERSRGGWHPAQLAQDASRLTIIFARDAEPER